MIHATEIKLERFYYNPLFRDYIFNFDSIKDRFQYDYRKPDSYKSRGCYIKKTYDDESRSRLVPILKTYNERLNCSSSTIENIESLRDKSSVVVIGGQQPGFLGGPVFIIYKILTILKLSSFIQEKFGIRAIPCFWNASDDSNFDNIDNLYFLGHELKKISLGPESSEPGRENSGAGQIRFSDIYFSSSRVKDVITEFTGFLVDTGFKPDIIDFLRDCIEVTLTNSGRDDRFSISSFFSVLVSTLFSRNGLVIIDPAIPEFKSLSAGILRFDVANHAEINNKIIENGKLLLSRGYHAQLGKSLNIDDLNFFQNISGKREKIVKTGEDKFIISGKLKNQAEINNIIDNQTLSLSLNVVLRPLLQDSILPVLCTVCGPGEVSYFAQLKEIYDMAGIGMPIIYPRFSATIFENKVSSAMEKTGICEEALELDKETLKKQILLKNKGEEINGMLMKFQDDMISMIKDLRNMISDRNIDTATSFGRIEKNIKKEIAVLHKKIYSDIKRNDLLFSAAVDKIYLNIFPDSNLQERVVNIFNYINKYGFGFLDDLYNEVIPMKFSHKFLKIKKSKDGS